MLKFQILLTLTYNLIYLSAECDTESAIKSKLIDLFSELIGFKFVATLVLVFKKVDSRDKIKYSTFHSSSKGEITINESYIDDLFQSIYTTIILNREKSLGKGSGWIIDSIIDHTISSYSIIY